MNRQDFKSCVYIKGFGFVIDNIDRANMLLWFALNKFPRAGKFKLYHCNICRRRSNFCLKNVHIRKCKIHNFTWSWFNNRKHSYNCKRDSYFPICSCHITYQIYVSKNNVIMYWGCTMQQRGIWRIYRSIILRIDQSSSCVRHPRVGILKD